MKTFEEVFKELANDVMEMANVSMEDAYRIVDHVVFGYNSERKNIIEASGQFVNGHISVNLSSIWSRLIKEAARVCDFYASDLLIDIASVEEQLETFVRNGEEHTWLFGFRRSGVDGNAFIAQRGIKSSEYVSMWSLTLHHIENLGYDDAWFCVSLRQE